MPDIPNRLREIRKYFGLSIKEFSQRIYVSNSLYGSIEHGDRELSDRICQLIASKFNVSKDYILKGEGSMFNADSPPDTRLNRILEIYNEVSDPLKEMILQMSRIILDHNENGKKADNNKNKDETDCG
jgi:transcriptional regulator with XRE-family HTH domain